MVGHLLSSMGWLFFVNIAALLVMGLDKLFAIGRQGRIPEIFFFFACGLGGFVGIGCGMLMFNHKKRKVSFWILCAVSVLIYYLITLT